MIAIWAVRCCAATTSLWMRTGESQSWNELAVATDLTPSLSLQMHATEQEQ